MNRIPFYKPRKKKKQTLFHKQQTKDKSMINVTILADSVSPTGNRITTMELVYPRFIHSEFMTHRIFNRNASSSRAIPTSRFIEQVRNSPVVPIHWGENQKGMSADKELSDADKHVAEITWNSAAASAALYADELRRMRVHKQVVNRILEPFLHIKVVVTSTQWNNFFGLRIHPNAQPEIQELARKMKEAYDKSSVIELKPGEWHLPYVSSKDNADAYNYCKAQRVTRDEPSEEEVNGLLIKISAARCARASYNNFEGKPSGIEEDLGLYAKLVEEQPVHASPTEHQATPMEVHSYSHTSKDGVNHYLNKPNDPLTWEDGISHMDKHQNLYSGSLKGWIQYRKLIPGECIN